MALVTCEGNKIRSNVEAFLFPHYSHVFICCGQYQHSQLAIGFTCHIVIIHQEQGRKLLWTIWIQTSRYISLFVLTSDFPTIVQLQETQDEPKQLWLGTHIKAHTHICHK